MTTSDYDFKFIVIGEPSVGKSCITMQFTDRGFQDKHHVTVGVEFGSKIIDIQDKKIKCQIWDTAGQDTFKSIVRTYYRSAAGNCQNLGALLVYDITNQNSFDKLESWYNEAKLYGNETMMFILIGNKSDLEDYREVSKQEGEEFAQKNDMLFLETSAKTSLNIQKVMHFKSEFLKPSFSNSIED